MNAATYGQVARTEAADAVCFHCGDALPQDALTVEVDGCSRAMCCSGCAAAAGWIEDAGLGDYYRLREREGARVASQGEDYALWDRADLMAHHVRTSAGGSEIGLLLEGMRCAACAWLIDRALQRVAGVHDVSVNAVTGRLHLRWNPTVVRLSVLMRRLAALGYTPHLAGSGMREHTRRAARRSELLRLGVAALGAMQAMMFAEALYLDVGAQMAMPTRDFLRWIALLVSTPVVFYSGAPFISGFARELRQRRFGMDTLIGGSILLAWAASGMETLRGGEHVWFDAAVMFVLLMLLARMVESRARDRASAHVDALARARPAQARRECDDGRVTTVPLEALEVGDIVQVAAGEPVPADCIALAPLSCDESLLSGESRAVAKLAGDTVHAGSLVQESSARLRVCRVGQDTRLSHLLRLVEHAQASRPALAQWADRLASRFVLVVVFAAIVAAAYWAWTEPDRSFPVALAVLVVSCPCALSLAIPTALSCAHAALARDGVLALRPDALPALARVDTVQLDKTGTLTLGRPRIASVQVFAQLNSDAALRIAAALENGHRHPIAQAFAGAGDQVATATRVMPGLGIEGEIGGRCWRLGRADFAAGREDDGAIWLGEGGRAAARFAVLDPMRDDARALVDALRELGLRCEISSGDSADAVIPVARALGIEAARARQSPQQKLERARELQREGHVVAMLGDGINDAPALAGADVSIAIAQGAALSHQAADFVLGGDDLQRLPASIRLARRAQRIVRQNLAWALGYNMLALPFAMAGLIPPWLAALGMALSSLAVTLNALRLLRPERRRSGTGAPPQREARAWA